MSFQPYQSPRLNHSLKEIPYQPYILKKLNEEPQKPFNEDNSSNYSFKPEYPFINKIYNLQSKIEKIQNENNALQSERNNIPLDSSFYSPDYQGKYLKPYFLNGNKKKYNNKLVLNKNKYYTPLRNNYNRYSNKRLIDDVDNLKRSYNTIQYSMDRKMEELNLKQQLNYEFLKKQLTPRSSKNNSIDNDFSLFNNLVEQRQYSFEDKIGNHLLLDDVINRNLEINLFNKYNRNIKIKQNQIERDYKIKNILNELINDYKNDIKEQKNISLPIIRNKNYNNNSNERIIIDYRLNNQRLRNEEKSNKLLDRIIQLQKENKVKTIKKKILRNQMLMIQNQMMQNQMMDYDYYPEKNTRYMRRRSEESG